VAAAEANLKNELESDLKTALKARDNAARTVIRMVLASIKNAEIAKQAPLTDADIIGIIAKEAKQHEESIEAFRQGNRDDLVSQQEAEMAVLQKYLPEAVSRDEIIETAKRIISEVGAAGPHDKGKVMSRIIPELKGKADGKEINAIVSELLGS